MRDIKFRAWDSCTNKMLNWAICCESSRLTLSNLLNGFIKHLMPMQYTGLKDKNGKAIYEGDIVKIHNYNTTWKNVEPSFDWRVFEIKYNVCTWAFNNEAIYMPMSDYSTYDGTPYDIEIIGNIYQNKDLLNENISEKTIQN